MDPQTLWGWRSISVCPDFRSCARAGNGHATAAPPISVMNSRRRIGLLPGARIKHDGTAIVVRIGFLNKDALDKGFIAILDEHQTRNLLVRNPNLSVRTNAAPVG
jgi:hypothetical protein